MTLKKKNIRSHEHVPAERSAELHGDSIWGYKCLCFCIVQYLTGSEMREERELLPGHDVRDFLSI